MAAFQGAPELVHVENDKENKENISICLDESMDSIDVQTEETPLKKK